LNINGGILAMTSATDAGKNITVDNLNIGTAKASGSFTQTGGTVTVNNGLNMAQNGFVGGYYLNSGNLKVGGPIADGNGYSHLSINGGTLNMIGANKNITVDSLSVGEYANGSHSQTAGTVTIQGLYLGTNSGGQGTYTLGGTGALSANYEYIGYDGTGTFNQTGGTNTVQNGLYLGLNSGSQGTYSLNGGTLNVGGGIYDGSGTSNLSINGGGLNMTGANKDITVDHFNIGTANAFGSFTQTGGTVTVHNGLNLAQNGFDASYNLNSGNLNVGGPITDGTGNSFLSINGGTLNMIGANKNITVDSLYVGGYANGSHSQTAGTVTVNNALVLGSNSGAQGAYSLGGGGALSANSEYIGTSGTGAFNQTGGTNSVQNTLYLGSYSGSQGTYTLGGTGALSASGNEIIGSAGTGTFNQTGGTNSVQNTLYLGFYSGSQGTYTLGGTGALSASGNEIIGNSGTGIFNQTGGTNTVQNFLYLGIGHGIQGTYSLNGGTLNVGGGIYDGSGTSTLSINGGGLNMTGANKDITVDHFNIGTANANGSFTQTGGTVTANNGLNMAQNGYAGSYQLKSGILNVGGAITDGTGSSTLSINGGTLNMTGSNKDISVDDFRIGQTGSGSHIQSAGTVTVNKQLTVAETQAGKSTYTLGGTGVLNADREIIGANGTGEFVQTGGENVVKTTLSLGNDQDGAGGAPSGNGTYTMTNGTLIANKAVVGDVGQGTFTQDGGSVILGVKNPDNSFTASGSLVVGQQGTSTGSYTLNGGSLVSATETIGDNGHGIFNQTSGTNTTNTLTLGQGATGSGTYNLSGGQLTTKQTNVDDPQGTGTFNQTSGTQTTQTLIVGSQGTYNLSGGKLEAQTEANNGQFNQTGGTNASNSLNIGSQGRYALSGDGSVTVAVAGATTNAGEVAQSGGSFKTDSLANSGTYNLSGGNLQATTSITNSGQFTQIAGDVQTSTLTNTGSAAISGGTLQATTEINAGNFKQTGGTNTATTIDNSGKFTLAGGSVAASFNNTGTVALTDGSNGTFTGAFTNTGAVQATNTTDSVFNGTFDNKGSLELISSMVSFDDLLVSGSGFLTADANSSFKITDDFSVFGGDTVKWDTTKASLVFDAGTSTDKRHDFTIAGADLGAVRSGYLGNFAWGNMTLASNDSLYLSLLDGMTSGALYLSSLSGADISGSMVTNMYGKNGLDIYYDYSAQGNDYLGGRSYMLADGGRLIAVGYQSSDPAAATPEPGTMILMGIGVASMAYMHRRKKRNELN